MELCECDELAHLARNESGELVVAQAEELQERQVAGGCQQEWSLITR